MTSQTQTPTQEQGADRSADPYCMYEIWLLDGRWTVKGPEGELLVSVPFIKGDREDEGRALKEATAILARRVARENDAV